MAVSNSTDYADTVLGLITDAYQDLGVLEDGRSPTATQLSNAKRRANRLLKAWQAEGVGLWLHQEVTLALAYQTQSYDLGPTGDHCSASMVNTALSADADSGDGTITVDSASGISDGDYIGIQLDDGTMQWTTVNGAPAGTTITLTTALTDDAAEDNVVRAYTTKTHRPLRIVRNTVRLIDTSNDETSMKEVSESDYKALADKTSLGTATQYYYDTKLTNGVFYVWPTADDVSKKIVMVIERPVYDLDDFDNNIDIPQEWYMALEYNLALVLAPMSKVDDVTFARIQGLASYYYNQAKDFDRENVSIFFEPDM